ncbi:radical SAM/SPASM domain-containing protein [Methylobacterium isbiliense]|jgi:radical SAM protein with 4Fe4S-binding SPASM domain|uniref:Mycofactocin radical SAM maturase MftC n=1 Tax=Methylobacterium isbiliense TaxID=315478 RepID=A0ABQ4SIL2_9HYPH|nr:radical SAM protein [Methylobacterium isbiliense]MDN3626397.1 radical SAM protein [Methylobacterium isbiliense]GJE03012.1 Putative mycofactocin radical SAM maturase MftC [Methylobacterium isbiliense]
MASSVTGTERSFSLGLGLTNECNLACSFCYRDPTRVDRLGPDQIRAVLDRLPVRSVNLGTGENGMHPRFPEMVALLRAEPIKLTITSNGHSIAVSDDAQVRAFADVEFSIDYPTPEEQDAQRGPGNWDLVMEQAARCRRLGVGVTFIAVMMRTNYDRLHEIAAVAARFGAPLRINVYQAVRSDAFALTYEEYWEGFATLFAHTQAIAIGEPLVRAMAGLPPRRGGCGAGTVRVTPRGTVQPCVYWGGPGQGLDVLIAAGPAITETEPFVAARALPEPCRGCAHEAACHGGCAGRRRLLQRLHEVDPYCPVVRGDDRRLAVTMAPARDLPKLESACTTIVQARDLVQDPAQDSAQDPP